MSGEGPRQVLCGLCKAPIGCRVEADPDGEVGCAGCGNWLPRHEAIKAAIDQWADEENRKIQRFYAALWKKVGLDELARNPVEDPQPRFILGPELR